MRSIIKLLILFGLAVVAALLLKDSNGYLMLVTNDERRTMSIPAAILIFTVAFVVLYVLFRIIRRVLAAPKAVSQWSDRRHERKDVALLERGWIELLEGSSLKAEKDLERLANHTKDNTRLALASMAAARAAHNLGHSEKRDRLLLSAREATKNEPRLSAAAATVQAELLLDEGKGQEALPHLEYVNSVDGNQVHIQKLMLRAYKQTGDSLKIIEMARVLNKKKHLENSEFKSLLEYTAANYIAKVSMADANSLYQTLSHEEKSYPNIALAMAGRYEHAGEPAQAAKALELALDREIDVRLLAQYTQCSEQEASNRLSKAQQWLAKDEKNPDILLALGHLCLVAKLWGQAERYLNKTLSLRDDAKVHALLGILNDRQGRPQEAMRHWRMASNATVALPLDHATILAAADTSNDPVTPPDVKNLDKPDDHFLSNKIESGRGELDDTEVYFDSAPIPGLDRKE